MNQYASKAYYKHEDYHKENKTKEEAVNHLKAKLEEALLELVKGRVEYKIVEDENCVEIEATLEM